MASKRRPPTITPAGRFIRGERFDRNPLRRSSDRAEAAGLILLILIFLACAPLAALGTGAWAHAMAQQSESNQLASRFQVTAITLAPSQTAPGPALAASEAKARWTAPDGRVVTGELPVPARSRAGTHVSTWVNRDGTPAQQPMGQAGVRSLTVIGAAVGPVLLGILVTMAGALGYRSLNKRRMAAWDADWRATGWRWTTRA